MERRLSGARLAGDEAWLTIKGRTEGITRAEFEYPIPPQDARELLEMCLPSVIDKTRHRVPFGGHVWEVDVFHGVNDGLVIAEVGFADGSVIIDPPPWAGLRFHPTSVITTRVSRRGLSGRGDIRSARMTNRAGKPGKRRSESPSFPQPGDHER